MIIDGLLYFMGVLVDSVAWVLPNWSIPNELIGALAEAMSGANAFADYIPLATLGWCLTIMLGFDIAVYAVRFFFRFINWVRGSGPLDL